MVFAVMALGLFVFIFFNQMGGDVMKILTEPVSVFILVMPFLPAALFANMARKAELQVKALMQGDEKAEGQPQ